MLKSTELKQKIELLEDRLNFYKKNEIDLRNQINKLLSKIEENKAEIETIKIEKILAEEKLKELELEIKKKYYENTEEINEIKTKIQLESELNILIEYNKYLEYLYNCAKPLYAHVPVTPDPVHFKYSDPVHFKYSDPVHF